MELIAFVCPYCGQELESADNLVGQEVSCPTCGKPLKVPAPSEKPTMTPEQVEAMKSRTIRIVL